MKIYLIASFIVLMSFHVRSQTSFSSQEKLSVTAYGDYQKEDFRWSIAGNSNGQLPNVLSEVIWKNIRTHGIGVDIQLNVYSNIIFKGHYHKAFIYGGTATDTDYADDNRTNSTYHASLNSDEGHNYDYSGALGYKFTPHKMLTLTPYAGYTRERQFLHLKHFSDEIENEENKLNSTYQTQWKGLLLGIDALVILQKRFSANAVFNYKQLSYHAQADWNLIDAFAHPVSFKHTANGFQTEALLQLNYKITPFLTVLIRGNYYHAETAKGKDQLFLVDGKQLESQFNEAVRNGYGAGIGISLHL